MALGKSAIAETRAALEGIKTKAAEAKSNDESFKALLGDENFQKFVSETSKGTLINEQFNSLYNWINSMTDMIETLKTRTDKFLDEQERINN